MFPLTAYMLHHGGKPWQNLGARTKAETKDKEQHCLLACSPCLVQPAFLYNQGPPAQECHFPQWRVILSQEKILLIKKKQHRLTSRRSAEGTFSAEVPFSQTPLACDRLITEKHHSLEHWFYESTQIRMFISQKNQCPREKS